MILAKSVILQINNNANAVLRALAILVVKSDWSYLLSFSIYNHHLFKSDKTCDWNSYKMASICFTHPTDPFHCIKFTLSQELVRIAQENAYLMSSTIEAT